MTFEEQYKNVTDLSEIESDLEFLCSQIGELKFFKGAMFILSKFFILEGEDEEEYRAQLKSIYDHLRLGN